MKCLLICFLLAPSLATGASIEANLQQSIKDMKVTIDMSNCRLTDILSEIKKQTNIGFGVNRNVPTEALNNYSIKVTDQTVESTINQLTQDSPVTYELVASKVVIVNKPSTTNLSQKSIDIQGKVVDENSKPIVGATVIAETGEGSITDDKGSFVLNLTKATTLEVSYLGFQTQIVEVSASNSNLVIKLVKDEMAVEDIVVIGYGTAKKKDLTGSVTSFSSKDLEGVSSSASIQSALQGRIAGVSTQVSSGSSTAGVSVIIRGQSSLSGNNQPLWVIDGVPDYSGTTSGSVSNVLYSLNLDDVENITILRDASATAIYGSRAANGVVIVTTKSGKRNQRPEISFSSTISFQKDDYNGLEFFESPEYIDFTRSAVIHEVETMGALDYFTRQYVDEPYLKTFMTSEIDRELIRDKENLFYDSNTNWLKEVGQTPINQNYDISIRGGGESTTYYASLFYKGYKGIVKTGYSNTVGGNLALEVNIDERLKFGISLRGSSRKTNARDDLMSKIRSIRPDIPVYNEDGTYFRKDYYTQNPIALLDNTNEGIGNNANVSPYLEYMIIPGLRLKTSPSISYNEAKSLAYTRSTTYGTTVTDATRSWSNSESTTYIWDNTLTYNKNINNTHDILGTIGFSLERSTSLYYYMAASKFADDDVLNSFSGATNKTSMTESYGENRLMSLFARVQYKYKDAYLLTATIRRDGSSKFGSDSRWGTFPSVGLGWIITEEDFMSPYTKTFTYLKFRASIGKTGSQNLGNYGYYAAASGGSYNGNPTMTPSAMANPELRWEESVMTDIGLDYGLLDDRIRGTIGWYQRNTSNLIYDQPLPPSSAYSDITANIAKTQNKGFEFDINADVLKTKDHLVTINLNAAHGVNRIIEFDGRMDAMYYTYNNSPTYATMRTLAGGKINQWYGYEYLRLFDTAEEARALETEDETGKKVAYNHGGRTFMRDGDLFIKDQNGDGVLNTDDYVELGSADPKLYGGFGLSYLWKGLSVQANFTYAVGHKRYWSLIDTCMQTGNYNQANKIGGNSYSYIGEGAVLPSATPYDYQDNGKFNSAYLFDASYLRLNDLTIRYRLPQEWYAGTILNNIELSFQATNLLTLTRYPGMDPQGNWSSTSIGTGMGTDYGTYPTSRLFTFGAKFTLK